MLLPYRGLLGGTVHPRLKQSHADMLLAKSMLKLLSAVYATHSTWGTAMPPQSVFWPYRPWPKGTGQHSKGSRCRLAGMLRTHSLGQSEIGALLLCWHLLEHDGRLQIACGCCSVKGRERMPSSHLTVGSQWSRITTSPMGRQ